MQAVFRNKKARVGNGSRRNGRCRLHEQEVALLRMLVYYGHMSRREASVAFMVTYRHVNAIMSGTKRVGDPGPIEQSKAHHVGAVDSLAYDDSIIIRCGCGAKTHPSRLDRTKCPLCARQVGTRN